MHASVGAALDPPFFFFYGEGVVEGGVGWGIWNFVRVLSVVGIGYLLDAEGWDFCWGCLFWFVLVWFVVFCFVLFCFVLVTQPCWMEVRKERERKGKGDDACVWRGGVALVV